MQSPRLQARIALPNSGSKPQASRRSRLTRSQARCKTLLWIDDYQPGLTAYKTIFEAHGYSVLTASSGPVGLRLLESHRADAVVLDYEMPEMDGGEVAAEIRRRGSNLPIVMFSACNSVPTQVKQLVNAFCDKAESPTLLISAIENAVSRPAAGVSRV